MHPFFNSDRASPASLPEAVRRTLWIAIVVASGVVFALAFECAAPYPAIAALAAISMSRRDALLLLVLAWLVNQAVGFGLLGYPWTLNSLAWGLAIGAGAVISGLMAVVLARRLTGSVTGLILIYVATFGINEIAIFLASLLIAGGGQAFEPFIVARLFVVDAVALAGLFVLLRAGEATGLVVRDAKERVQSVAAY